jgi:hypothetical protein
MTLDSLPLTSSLLSLRHSLKMDLVLRRMCTSAHSARHHSDRSTGSGREVTVSNIMSSWLCSPTASHHLGIISIDTSRLSTRAPWPSPRCFTLWSHLWSPTSRLHVFTSSLAKALHTSARTFCHSPFASHPSKLITSALATYSRL